MMRSEKRITRGRAISRIVAILVLAGTLFGMWGATLYARDYREGYYHGRRHHHRGYYDNRGYYSGYPIYAPRPVVYAPPPPPPGITLVFPIRIR